MGWQRTLRQLRREIRRDQLELDDLEMLEDIMELEGALNLPGGLQELDKVLSKE